MLNSLFDNYDLEGIPVSYTMKDFQRDYVRNHLGMLSPDEVLDKFSPDDRLKGLSPDEVLQRFSPNDRLKGLSPDEVLQRFSPHDRLKGLSPEEIKLYLKQLDENTEK